MGATVQVTIRVLRIDRPRAHPALWHTVREIEETRAAVAKAGGDVRAVPQNADACLKHGTPCPYLPLCEGTANAADVTRYRRLPVVHGELPTEIQTTRAA